MEEKQSTELMGVTEADQKYTESIVSAPPLDPETIAAKAEELVNAAHAANPPLEARLKYLADVNQGLMRGLEFKVKPLTSLVRKMNKMYRPGMSLAELSDAQYDVLRYTMEMPNSHYVDGVKQVMRELVTNEGCKEFEVKNYWDCMTYRGINCIFISQTGVKFELQFHTPESFDQKQNKTHILYEVLRRESDAVKQNLFFSDMMTMWDNVALPKDVKSIGSLRTQPMPERKVVSADQQAMIDRVWGIKQVLRNNILQVRKSVEDADPLVSLAVNYACAIHKCHVKELDNRFKGTLKMRRKVENELRRKANVHLASQIHEVDLPTHLDGLPLEDYLDVLCRKQADALLFKVVCEDEDAYSNCVVGVIDVMRKNGFDILSVSNFWEDLEKHHGISVTLRVPPNHPIPHECLFKMEFHTKATYECTVERRTALTHIEELMYEKGEVYNKTAADMQVRFDATMIRHWAHVPTPQDAKMIGKLRKQDPHTNTMETDQLDCWATPSQRKEQRRALASHSLTLIAGMLLGGAIAGLVTLKKQ